MKIFFAGILASKASTGWQRKTTMIGLGHDVKCLSLDFFSNPRRWRRRLDGRAFEYKNVEAVNYLILEQIRNFSPEVIWLEKCLLLKPETLDQIRSEFPSSVMVAFQDDNPFGMRRYEEPFWRLFIECIPFYDLHFVKRGMDIANFKKAGARAVEIFTTGYFQDYFDLSRFPARGDGRFNHDASFLGTAMDGRGLFIAQLMLRFGVDIHVYGARWNRVPICYIKRSCFHGFLREEDRLPLYYLSRINLGFVSVSNCDEYTGRSFEIPASKGFLLAMRTSAHQQFFSEGVEAEFFSSVEECAEKIKFYLTHDEARAKIAEAGYNRCIASDYSLRRRIRDALKVVGEFRN
jgi:hypothetical protein